MEKVYDHIIIGQGIAGTCLAARLIDKGQDVLVIDNDHHHASSMVAAGKWNPVVFKKLNKSWMIDELLPFALDFYGRWEKRLGIKFVHTHKNIRVFKGPGEQNMWFEKVDDPGYRDYISIPSKDPLSGLPVKHEHGTGIVKGGHIDLPLWLHGYAAFLNQDDRLIRKKVDPGDIDSSDENFLSVDGHKTKHITFCQGHQSNQNPWFKGLPLKDTKGEVLMIKAPELRLTEVVSHGFFILPLGEDVYTVGATFKRNDNTNTTTPEAREEIVQRLKNLLEVPFEVIEQKAGVRPASGDRRPIMGLHPKDNRVGIFNGFGAKGVVLAPYWAEQYARFLVEDQRLDPIVNLSRFRGW